MLATMPSTPCARAPLPASTTISSLMGPPSYPASAAPSNRAPMSMLPPPPPRLRGRSRTSGSTGDSGSHHHHRRSSASLTRSQASWSVPRTPRSRSASLARQSATTTSSHSRDPSPWSGVSDSADENEAGAWTPTPMPKRFMAAWPRFPPTPSPAAMMAPPPPPPLPPRVGSGRGRPTATPSEEYTSIRGPTLAPVPAPPLFAALRMAGAATASLSSSVPATPGNDRRGPTAFYTPIRQLPWNGAHTATMIVATPVRRLSPWRAATAFRRPDMTPVAARSVEAAMTPHRRLPADYYSVHMRVGSPQSVAAMLELALPTNRRQPEQQQQKQHHATNGPSRRLPRQTSTSSPWAGAAAHSSTPPRRSQIPFRSSPLDESWGQLVDALGPTAKDSRSANPWHGPSHGGPVVPMVAAASTTTVLGRRSRGSRLTGAWSRKSWRKSKSQRTSRDGKSTLFAARSLNNLDMSAIVGILVTKSRVAGKKRRKSMRHRYVPKSVPASVTAQRTRAFAFASAMAVSGAADSAVGRNTDPRHEVTPASWQLDMLNHAATASLGLELDENGATADSRWGFVVFDPRLHGMRSNRQVHRGLPRPAPRFWWRGEAPSAAATATVVPASRRGQHGTKKGANRPRTASSHTRVVQVPLPPSPPSHFSVDSRFRMAASGLPSTLNTSIPKQPHAARWIRPDAVSYPFDLGLACPSNDYFTSLADWHPDTTHPLVLAASGTQIYLERFTDQCSWTIELSNLEDASVEVSTGRTLRPESITVARFMPRRSLPTWFQANIDAIPIVVATSRGMLYVVDAATGTPLAPAVDLARAAYTESVLSTMPRDSRGIPAMAWRPNGSELAVGTALASSGGFIGPGRILVLDWRAKLASPQVPVTNFIETPAAVMGLAWQVNALAAGMSNGLVAVWEAQGPHALLPSLPTWTCDGAHTTPVKAIAWCPWERGVLATGGGVKDRMIKQWRVPLIAGPERLMRQQQHRRRAGAVNTTISATRPCAENGLMLAIDSGSQVAHLHFSAHHRELVAAMGHVPLPAGCIDWETDPRLRPGVIAWDALTMTESVRANPTVMSWEQAARGGPIPEGVMPGDPAAPARLLHVAIAPSGKAMLTVDGRGFGTYCRLFDTQPEVEELIRMELDQHVMPELHMSS
ncbi:hypothetical protein BC828DRAFT_409372 [Blastocladiella britannica]|nr:hypothetical protein BC828DRAFT_409372 [Blastocladiella britannica]